MLAACHRCLHYHFMRVVVCHSTKQIVLLLAWIDRWIVFCRQARRSRLSSPQHNNFHRMMNACSHHRILCRVERPTSIERDVRRRMLIRLYVDWPSSVAVIQYLPQFTFHSTSNSLLSSSSTSSFFESSPFLFPLIASLFCDLPTTTEFFFLPTRRKGRFDFLA